MNVALKEWASVVAALGSGRQIMLLRKGGIVEAARLGFELRHRQFLLFPTFEHQQAQMLKAEFHHLVTAPSDTVPIEFMAEAADIFPAPATREWWSNVETQFVWNESYLKVRYEYRPDLPLYIILVRVFRLALRHNIEDRPSYAGCKSWVNLTEDIPVDSAQPVLPDKQFEDLRKMYIEVICAS